MRLKLYRGASVPAVMARVRAELGPEALILGSRRVRDGVELTAALEASDDHPPPPDPGRAATLAFHGVPDTLRPGLLHGDLPTALARVLAFAPLPLTGEVLLLTGPPGAGKTLTVARLATRLVLAGTPPLVIAADGRKAGATEQLAALTRVLGVRLCVPDCGAALATALRQRPVCAPVLIDGTGLDPFDPEAAQAHQALAVATGATVVLVLPAGLDPAEAADLGRAFGALGARLLVATRLDCTRRMGGVLAAADAARLPLTEAGVGPGVADGLVPFTPALLAAHLQQTDRTLA